MRKCLDPQTRREGVEGEEEKEKEREAHSLSEAVQAMISKTGAIISNGFSTGLLTHTLANAYTQ